MYLELSAGRLSICGERSVRLRPEAVAWINLGKLLMSAVKPPSDRAGRLVEGWADYRRRQRIARLMSIAFIPLAALIALAVEAVTRTDRFISLFVVPLGVLVFGAWSWFVLFRCPNCGRHFHITESWRLTGGRRCPHCGLERYQAD